MANYNTFVVQRTKDGRALLVTSSARKAKRTLSKGLRVEVWNENHKVETIYNHTRAKLTPYVTAEREHIHKKQAEHEARNQRRRERRENTA